MSMRCWSAALVLLLFAAPTLGKDDRESLAAGADSVLRMKSTVADSLYRLARQAGVERNHGRAIELYLVVESLVPGFSAATRLRAYEHIKLGNRFQARELLDSLVRRDPDPWNEVARASALAEIAPDAVLDAETATEAKLLLDRAIPRLAGQSYPWKVACRVGIASEDAGYALRAAKERLRLEPDEWSAWYGLAAAHVVGGHLGDAEKALVRARDLGIPQVIDESLVDSIASIRAERLETAYSMAVPAIFAAWVIGLLLLSLAGLTLSRATLRMADRASQQGQGVGEGGWLRGLYRAVLWVGCAYFYVSIPLVVILVMVVGAGVLYLSYRYLRLPLQLLLMVLTACLATVGVIVRGLMIALEDQDPGMRLDLSGQPRLRQLLDRVAERLSTRPVDDVFLTPGPEVGVLERGGVGRTLTQNGRRCLVLGVAVLEGMTVGQFKSIMAHEYGHFSNRDTAGGQLALSVRHSLAAMAIHFQQSRAGTWYNPAWWFIRGYQALFLRISQGASRLQEILADRRAALAYGPAAFAASLSTVIAASARYELQVIPSVIDAITRRRSLPNLYRSNTSADDRLVCMRIEELMNQQPSPYDSHPAPAQRTAWVAAMDAPSTTPDPEDTDEAWGLLADRDRLERLMTGQIVRAVAAARGYRVEEIQEPVEPVTSGPAA